MTSQARSRTAHELRCFCARRPLLAVYGVDDRQRLYLHIKIYKQDRIFGEIVMTGGDIKIHCRECLRWHRVVMRTSDASLAEVPTPQIPQLRPLRASAPTN